VVTGMAMKDLLEKLAAIDIDLDPLAALGGVGGGLAMAGPEAGGSIRAHKDMPLPQGAFKDAGEEERFTATVVSVEQKAFPEVVLTIKTKTAPESGALKIAKKKTYSAVILLPGANGAIDYANPQCQKNLVAFFLMDGDRVELHAIKMEGETLYIDSVKRLK
jgi:hypothetical protein